MRKRPRPNRPVIDLVKEEFDLAIKKQCLIKNKRKLRKVKRKLLSDLKEKLNTRHLGGK